MDQRQFTGQENHGDHLQQPPGRNISGHHSPQPQYHMGTAEGYQAELPTIPQEPSRPILPQMGQQFHCRHSHSHPPPQIVAQHMSATGPIVPMAMGYPRVGYPGYYPGQHFQQTPGWNQMTLSHTCQHDRSQGYYPRPAHQELHTAHHHYALQVDAAGFGYPRPQYPSEYLQMMHERSILYHHAQLQQDIHPRSAAQNEDIQGSAYLPHTQVPNENVVGPAAPKQKETIKIIDPDTGSCIGQAPPVSIVSPEYVEEPQDPILNCVPRPQLETPDLDLTGVISIFTELARKNLDLQKKVKDSEEREQSLQAKIHGLEEEVGILKLELTGTGGQEDGTNFTETRDLLEENKLLKLEQLELTVQYQMKTMWENIVLDMKSLSEGRVEMMNRDEEDGHGGREGMAIEIMKDVQVQLEGKTNPLLIRNILDKIFDSLPLSCLFKCRRVCRLWNKILVPKINQNENNTRLLKIVDPLLGERGIIPGDDDGPRVKVIDIKEILVTMEAGRLESSTCTKIYFNDSMEFNPSVFETFLTLHGKNIKVLHYDGDKYSELKRLLKACAQNLECLTLWRSGQCSKDSRNGLYENDEEPRLIFPKLGNIIFLSGQDGNFKLFRGFTMEYINFTAASGFCNPSENFLIDIFEASPKLHSLSCRLYKSRILEALSKTNSFSKLTSLCLKSRVEIPQLRSLISAKIRLKILQLEGLCVSMYEQDCRYYVDSPIDRGHNDPELMEFAPLLLEFLKCQASTLEYLKLHLFTARNPWKGYREIPTDVLLNHFPRMPKLITFAVGSVDGGRIAIDFPIEISTFGELFPKLRNLDNVPHHNRYESKYYYPSIIDELQAALEGGEDEEFPANYSVSPNASFSLKNIRGVRISPSLAQFFPFITELHLDGNIGSLHKIPFCLPRLKHFYHVVQIKNNNEDEVLKLIRILNSFLTGISPAECQTIEEVCRYPSLSSFQFARSRPSIFNLNDLETLDLKFSCNEYVRESTSIGGISSAIDVLMSWGLSRMTHLKKLCFQYERQLNSLNHLPNSHYTLLEAFGNRNNLETHSQGYNHNRNSGWDGEIRVERNWNFELNPEHHISEWDQFRFYSEDPDIWDLGFDENEL